MTLVNAFRSCASIKDACAVAKCGPGAFRKWREVGIQVLKDAGLDIEELPENWERSLDPEDVIFAALYIESDAARSETHVKLLNAIKLAALGGQVFDDEGNVIQTVEQDWRAAAKLLAMRSHEYAEHRRHEHTGKGGKPIQVNTYRSINLPEQVNDAVERAHRELTENVVTSIPEEEYEDAGR